MRCGHTHTDILPGRSPNETTTIDRFRPKLLMDGILRFAPVREIIASVPKRHDLLGSEVEEPHKGEWRWTCIEILDLHSGVARPGGSKGDIQNIIPARSGGDGRRRRRRTP